MSKFSQEFLDLCHSITAKRPKTVIDHILEHDFITTQDLKEQYGYNHPPRAIRDVKEQGIAIEMFRVTGTDGRKIAAYRFATEQTATFSKGSGRTELSKKLKTALIKEYGSKCFIYLETMDERALQIDHRVPFEIGGDDSEHHVEDFMLLSGSANRAKSWSCEHCENWKTKDKTVCMTCYWAYPENYAHIGMRQIRRLDLVWQGDDIKIFERLKTEANLAQKGIPLFVKEIIEREVNRKS